MTCLHCMRGDAENVDMPRSYQSKLLDQVASIYVVTFTGGEPSLYPQAIMDFVDLCKERNITVANYYLATNGKHVDDEFIYAVNKLHGYCGDNIRSNVHISKDRFHEPNPAAIEVLLKELPLVHLADSGEESGYIYVNEGRYTHGIPARTKGFEIKDESVLGQKVYLNCEGNIIAGCWWSFESQREKDKIVCDVNRSDFRDAIKAYNKQFLQPWENPDFKWVQIKTP